MATALAQLDWLLGPRVEGGRYFCGYWRQEYTLDAVLRRGDMTMLRVTWADGRVTTHCTPWNERADRVVVQPCTP